VRVVIFDDVSALISADALRLPFQVKAEKGSVPVEEFFVVQLRGCGA
jgi:hypothetical protein